MGSYYRTVNRVLRADVGRVDTGTGGSATEYRLIQPVRRTRSPHAKSVFMRSTWYLVNRFRAALRADDNRISQG